MKVRRRCPKCGSSNVGFLERVVDKGRLSDEDAAVGVTVCRDAGWLLREVAFVGSLEAYVCTNCGYFEHYVRDPKALDFEGMTGFEWVNDLRLASGRPYR